MKKKIRLTESEMVTMIETIVNEIKREKRKEITESLKKKTKRVVKEDMGGMDDVHPTHGDMNFADDEYMELELSAGVNFDDYQRKYVRRPIKPIRVPISSFEEASSIVRKFIDKNDLGGGNWTGGQIYKNGKEIAYVSYNGRVWEQ